MTDIVERLRQGIERSEEGDAEAAMDKAADEIERLRARVKMVETQLANALVDMARKPGGLKDWEGPR